MTAECLSVLGRPACGFRQKKLTVLRCRPDAMQAEERRISCVFVGDAAVGKTRMVMAAVRKEHKAEEEEAERMFYTYHTTMEVDGAPTRVELCDTQADADHQDQRKRCCQVADLIFVCFRFGGLVSVLPACADASLFAAWCRRSRWRMSPRCGGRW